MLDSLYPKYYLAVDYGGGGADSDAGSDTGTDMGSDTGGDVNRDTNGDFEIILDAYGRPKIPSDNVLPPDNVIFVIGGGNNSDTPILKRPQDMHIISRVKGDFNYLDSDGEEREYIIMGDIGSKFTLTVNSSNGCDIFNDSLEILELGRQAVIITFPKIYEYTTYTITLKPVGQTTLGGGMNKIEHTIEMPQYIYPTITLSYATEDPYTTNCAYSGDDVTFTARYNTQPPTYHSLTNATFGKLTHTVTATITTGYLYIIKNPFISDYLLLDNRAHLSTTDLDKTLKLGDDETTKIGTIAVAESASKKIITLTSTVQIESVGKEDTVYELDIDSIITNIPQAFGQEVSTLKDTAITIDILNGVGIKTYLIPAITLSPNHGTLVVTDFEAGVGTCVYTPNDSYQGIDEFKFEVSDGTNTSEDQYTVRVNVGDISCEC